MLKGSLKILLALLLAFVAYLFYQASVSQRDSEHQRLVAEDSGPAITTIAFGSCNRQDESQAYWETIGSHNPRAWLWLGDNVYSDTDDMEQMAADYAQQKNAPEYAAFTASVPLIYGGWDDHDYGSNDAGKEWAAKDEAKENLLAFLEVPATAEVRNHPGTYQAYTIGEGERSVRIIILDTRYFRDAFAPSTRAGSRYGQNPEGDILGADQWAWLEGELRNSTAAAHLICSSIQVLPTDHPYEKWSLFPSARQRLLDLLTEVKPTLTLLLSGDRHLAEFSVEESTGYTITEMTSSGLTHSYSGSTETNDKRIGPLVTDENFGLLHFIWEATGPHLLAEIRGIANDNVLASTALPSISAGEMTALTETVHNNRSMATKLKPCPGTPNCVSTQSTQPKKKREPIPFKGTAAEAKEKLKRIVAATARTELQKEEGNYLHYTFKTWPIPFIDDVEFVIDEQAKVIHYRSASRVGKSDLGTNSRRMKKLVEAFKVENS